MVIVQFILATLCGLVACIYLFYKYKFNHWENVGVEYVKPSFPFGNFGENFMMRKNFAEVSQDLYNKAKYSILGIYLMFKPALLVIDPVVVRDILIKDSQYFINRGLPYNEEIDKLSASLFFLSGSKWKAMRHKMSPTFTTGKLKMIFQTICDCGETLDKALQNVSEKDGKIDTHDILSRFTVNVVISVAFGVEIDCINKKEDDIFHQIGMTIFEPSLTNLGRQFFCFMVPELAKILKIRISSPECEKFFIPFVKKNLEYREQNNIIRHDFFQLLLQLRNTGTIKVDDEWDVSVNHSNNKEKKASIDEICAQAFVFFGAGFETTATTMSFCIYELARNPELQKRVQKEIDEVLARHDNKISYDSLVEMNYLESCIDETLRKYPPLPFLNRENSESYKFANSNATIAPGTAIHIPIFALQRDPKYFPDPLKFDPDRFYIKGNLDSNAPYYPFGNGPRICIGIRLGKMKTKVGLSTLLRKYFFELTDELKKSNEVEFNPKCVILTPINPLKLIVKQR